MSLYLANVIRVLNNEDLEFLTAAEEARKAHSEALRRDTEARLEAFRRQSKALQSEHPNIDPKGILQLNPKAINVKTSKQKELLKMAIRKKK